MPKWAAGDRQGEGERQRRCLGRRRGGGLINKRFERGGPSSKSLQPLKIINQMLQSPPRYYTCMHGKDGSLVEVGWMRQGMGTSPTFFKDLARSAAAFGAFLLCQPGEVRSVSSRARARARSRKREREKREGASGREGETERERERKRARERARERERERKREREKERKRERETERQRERETEKERKREREKERKRERERTGKREREKERKREREREGGRELLY